MPKNKDKNATLVGFFLFLGLAILGIMIALFSNISEKLNGDYNLQLTFPDASGLVKDSNVSYGGAKVGRVLGKPILQDDQSVLINIKVKGSVKIPKGSDFSISSVSLLGDKAVSISHPVDKSSGFYKEGDIIAGNASGGLGGIKSKAEELANNATLAIADLRNVAQKIDKSIEGFDTLVAQTNIALKRINGNVLTEDNTKNFAITMANIRNGSEAIKKIKPLVAKMEPFIEEARETLSVVKTATATAQMTFAKASVQIDALEPALTELPETLKNFQTASQKASSVMTEVEGVTKGAKKIIAKVNNGDGVIGSLTTDSKLKEDTEEFVKNLKKYGVLRYRDLPTKEKESVDPKFNRFKGGRR